MKKTLTILTFLSLIYCIVSCEKDNTEERNFFESDYRTGLWISPDKRDTLDFIDSSNLIRKGDFYKYEDYFYRIEGRNLLIRPPNSSLETQHPILTVNYNRIVLGNMYISIGFTDNSGIFIKEASN